MVLKVLKKYNIFDTINENMDKINNHFNIVTILLWKHRLKSKNNIEMYIGDKKENSKFFHINN